MFKNALKELKKFHQDENGDIVQTGVIMGVLAVVALGAMMFLKDPIKRLFTRAGDVIDDAADFDAGF